MRGHAFALCVALTATACGSDDAEPAPKPPANFTFSAEAWNEADGLFHADPRWIGGDAAYSVDLGGDRMLWLFGDSFVATSDKGIRSESKMVRNSVALQVGGDPTLAGMVFYWNQTGAEPSSYVPEAGAEWYWPLHGIKIGESLTLFFLREAASSDGLGFDAVGSQAFRVESSEAPVDQWKLEPLPTPTTTFPVAVGTSVLRLDSFVYAYAVQEPGFHDVYLLRWKLDDFNAGNLMAPEWHDGERGFVSHAELEGPPTAVMQNAQTEFTVSYSKQTASFIEIQSRGFGATTIAFRKAEHPEGPWSELEDVFRPPESDRDDAFVYAGKAHAELRGADLLVTYAANAKDFQKLIEDTTLYFPRFVKLTTTPIE